VLAHISFAAASAARIKKKSYKKQEPKSIIIKN